MYLTKSRKISNYHLRIVGKSKGFLDSASPLPIETVGNDFATSTKDSSPAFVLERFSSPDVPQEEVKVSDDSNTVYLTKNEEFQERHRQEREGDLDMNERRCWRHKHPPDCRECDLEAQTS